MTRLAISGHRGLAPEVAALIAADLEAVVAQFDDGQLVGLTCLADGADQLFARAILQRGGQLEVFVPAREYREGLPDDVHAAYDELLGRATAVQRLDHQESSSQAHMDASEAMLRTTDRLIAVWDGEPARAFGGTADVVHAAEERGVPVRVVWPVGAWR